MAVALPKSKLTKAQLETELDRALVAVGDAQRELVEFKERVPVVMQEKIDEYGIDVCSDGIADFCQTLGVNVPSIEMEAAITVYADGFSLKGRSDRYSGTEFTDSDKFVDQITEAICKVIKDFTGGAYPSISVDIEER